jgi:hypothetical protein
MCGASAGKGPLYRYNYGWASWQKHNRWSKPRFECGERPYATKTRCRGHTDWPTASAFVISRTYPANRARSGNLGETKAHIRLTTLNLIADPALLAGKASTAAVYQDFRQAAWTDSYAGWWPLRSRHARPNQDAQNLQCFAPGRDFGESSEESCPFTDAPARSIFGSLFPTWISRPTSLPGN